MARVESVDICVAPAVMVPDDWCEMKRGAPARSERGRNDVDVLAGNGMPVPKSGSMPPTASRVERRDDRSARATGLRQRIYAATFRQLRCARQSRLGHLQNQTANSANSTTTGGCFQRPPATHPRSPTPRGNRHRWGRRYGRATGATPRFALRRDQPLETQSPAASVGSRDDSHCVVGGPVISNDSLPTTESSDSGQDVKCALQGSRCGFACILRSMDQSFPYLRSFRPRAAAMERPRFHAIRHTTVAVSGKTLEAFLKFQVSGTGIQ